MKANMDVLIPRIRQLAEKGEGEEWRPADRCEVIDIGF